MVLRPLLISVSIALLASCSSKWETIPLEQPCNPYPYFFDGDGDGWGDPNQPAVDVCPSKIEAPYTAENGRDCDDADVSVTGRVGGLCPIDVLGAASTVVQFASGEHEYLIARPPDAEPTDGSETIWPDYAEEVCAPAGWGGTVTLADDEASIDPSIPEAGLVTIQDESELGAIEEQVDADYWAGWVGAVSYDTGATTTDPDGNQVPVYGWKWENDVEGIPFELVGYCDGISSPPADGALNRLALVKRTLLAPDGTRKAGWCFGNPEQVFGRYFKDVKTSLDNDGDGLPDLEETGTNRNDFDSDNDGIGDGQEVDVLGTNPGVADEFPVILAGDNPDVAYQSELSYFVCERQQPVIDRWAVYDAGADTDTAP